MHFLFTHVILALWIYKGYRSTAEATPKTFRCSPSEEIEKGKILNSSFILPSTSVMQSESKCALLCNKNDRCLSFGFCGGGTCKLYSVDIHSTEQGEKILQKEGNCDYFGMKKEAKPGV